MSFDFNHGHDIPLPAAGDLSAKQYRFVTLNSSGQIAASTRGALSCGVLQDKPAAAGRSGAVRYNGVTKIKLGGSVTAGNAIVSDANGDGVTTASSDTNYMGIALESGASGEIVAMLLQPRGLS